MSERWWTAASGKYSTVLVFPLDEKRLYWQRAGEKEHLPVAHKESAARKAAGKEWKMGIRTSNLFYAVNVEMMEQLSDMQQDLSDALMAIAEGYEELRNIIDSLDIPTISDTADSVNSSDLPF